MTLLKEFPWAGIFKKNLDVLYTWSRNINAFKVKNIE
jgi:hypothetical protein